MFIEFVRKVYFDKIALICSLAQNILLIKYICFLKNNIQTAKYFSVDLLFFLGKLDLRKKIDALHSKFYEQFDLPLARSNCPQLPGPKGYVFIPRGQRSS